MIAFPSIAVIMTAHNAEMTIGWALASVLNQQYEGRWGVIVVDDGSTDGTCDVVSALHSERLVLIRSERVGRARALNRALLEAHGYELVCNLDADDYMLPGRMQRQALAFRDKPDLGVLGGAYVELHQGDDGSVSRAFVVKPPRSWSDLRRQLSVGVPLCHSCVTYRRLEAMQLGGFDPRRTARIDFDLWLRMAIAGYSLENVEDLVGIHVKRSGSFFDKQFSRWRSAGQMARLNFLAAMHLDLGIEGWLRACARVGYSLLRHTSVKSQPRFSFRLALPPASLGRVQATVELLMRNDLARVEG